MIPPEERQSLLEYEDFVTEISKRRNPPHPKPWWESAGIVSALTAITTVALTSTAAYFTQSRLRDKDFFTQQSKAAYESEVTVLQSAHALANESLFWASERVRLLATDYRTLPPEQWNVLKDSVNASDTKWRQGRQSQKVGIELLFGNDPNVVRAWGNVVSTLDQYANCSVATPGACSELKPAAERAIESFRTLGVAYARARSRVH